MQCQIGRLQPIGRNHLKLLGFNGKENDNELLGEGHLQDYGFRPYLPALGRFFSPDPLTQKYPELTTYQFASNSPVSGVDLDGLEYLNSSEALIEIRNGAIRLKIENWSNASKEALSAARNNPSNWNIGCENPDGCIGLDDRIALFELQPLLVPSELKTGVSMDPSYTPDVDYTQNPYRVNITPRKKDGTFDRRYNPKIIPTNSPRGTVNVARGSMAATLVTLGLDVARTYGLRSDNNTLSEHMAEALKVKFDIESAVFFGKIPTQHLNTMIFH